MTAGHGSAPHDDNVLDRMVREAPELAYEADFLTSLRVEGHLTSVTR